MSNVTGRKLTAFILPEYSPALEMLLIKAKSEDIKLELALLNQTSGMQLPCQVSMTRLPIDKEMAFSVIITDLTFHKLTEGVLKQKNDELAKTVAELESSNHDLQQFASVASHDLQEPLRKIILFSGMLRDKLRAACSETGIEFLEKIIASSRRMRTLITDILQYSRLSQDDNHLVSTNLGDLVREVLQDFDLLIQEKGAAVTLGALPEAEVNPGQMRQVFQNLISNALKFSRPGVRPEIAIQCLPADDEHPGAPCTILIKDNGIGFSQQYADRIFSLFQRLNTKDTFEGSGIGLAITKKIMDKHKGAIEAQSEEGRGSAFVLRLPLRQ